MKNIFDKFNSLALWGVVYATSNTTSRVVIDPPANATTLERITIQALISGLISLVFIVASLVFFFMLVTGGIKWMMAGGDKEKVGGARSQLTSALIGLIVIFLSWAISQLLRTLFGVDILGEFTIPAFFN